MCESIARKLPRDRARCGECDRAILFVLALDCAAVELAVWEIVDSKLPERRTCLAEAARARQRDAEFDVDERVDLRQFVVPVPSPLDDDLGFLEGVQDFAVEKFVPELPIEGFHGSVLPWTPRLRVTRLKRAYPVERPPRKIASTAAVASPWDPSSATRYFCQATS